MAEAVVTAPDAVLPPGKPANDPPADAERKAREAEIKKRGAELKAEKDGLNKQRAALLAEQKALEDERREIAEFKKWRSQATVDPDAFLGPVYGKDWRDKLAKATAGDTTPLAVQQLRQEWEAERKARADGEEKQKREAAEKAEADKKAAAEEEERVFKEYVASFDKWEHADKFPSLTKTGLLSQIAYHVRAIHGETGKLPDELEVAKDLEQKLDKLLDGVYETPKWSEKLAAKFKPAAPVTRPREAPQYIVKPRTPQGISQEMTSGTKPPAKPLSREERKKLIVGLNDKDWEAKVEAARRPVPRQASGE